MSCEEERRDVSAMERLVVRLPCFSGTLSSYFGAVGCRVGRTRPKTRTWTSLGSGICSLLH